MTACSLLCLLFFRIQYLTTLGLEISLSNISVKYSEENRGLRGRHKDGKYRIKIGIVHCGRRFYCYTHSLRTA